MNFRAKFIDETHLSIVGWGFNYEIIVENETSKILSVKPE